MEQWSNGVMEQWSDGVMECWSVEGARSRNGKAEKLKSGKKTLKSDELGVGRS
jgi:hypothetical protein